MPRSDNLYALPADLPVPVDDGACDHLPGLRLPPVPLQSTAGDVVDLADRSDRIVLYIYPRAGHPDREGPKGWNEIPGARGCTPQSCGFRDHYAELRKLGATVFGMSTQSTETQRETAARLHLPFDLLSDADLAFATALDLPTFVVDGEILIKRITLVIERGRIQHIFYPVFPPDRSAADVIAWLASGR